MHGAKEIVEEAASLPPVEERVPIIDSLLRTINPVDPAIDREWVAVARCRLEEIRSGAVVPVPGDVVFSRVRDRLKQ